MGGRGILVLALLSAVAGTQADATLVAALVLPLLAGLLAIEIDRASGRMSRGLATLASQLLPARDRADLRDEWLDHVASAGEHGVLPLTRALSIALLAAPLLAVGLRVGRRTRRRSA
jgi:hypothetical protein